MIENQKYSPQKVVAVDVDNTLVIPGVGLNKQLIEWIRHMRSKGFAIYLWSARGVKHAMKCAVYHGVDHLFDQIISKPGYIVDDTGWGWIKYTKILRMNELQDDE